MVLIVDVAFGERLREFAERAPVWIVPSAVNRAAVEEIWAERKDGHDLPPVTVWSDEKRTSTEEEWLALLDDIEVHHGELWSSPPLRALEVHGAAPTAAAQAALREYDYDTIEATPFGFVAYKRASA